ncbi:FUN14 family-domain-containing protein [Coprinopsis sp. MPI-PUGE-AT-0042]|nr:FUN14 family-domain-containing protein [Coprinopsis sp. MPI-PUGE-AT-0042]
MLVSTIGLSRNLAFNTSSTLAFKSAIRTARPSLRPVRFQPNNTFATAAAVLRPAVRPKPTVNLLPGIAAAAAVGLGIATWQKEPVRCDAPVIPEPHVVPAKDLPPPPTSSLSLYDLGFGTVAGMCAGIFVKKGVKAAAWLLGGVFVLLQYLNSQSLVRVDWSRMATRFQNRFHTVDPATGASRAPNVGGLWRWMVNFLTADFQGRASFIAGFALGLRI